MNVHSDSYYQTTVEPTYGFPRLDATRDGNLCSNTQSCELTVPPPTTSTVVQPYMPTVLNCFEHSESHGCSKFGFCSPTTKLNLRDLILLDNQSTVDIFCNKRLLKGLNVSDDSITVYGNGGAFTANQKGTLRNYGKVWYHADAITNILSLKRVRSKFKLTYKKYKKTRIFKCYLSLSTV